MSAILQRDYAYLAAGGSLWDT